MKLKNKKTGQTAELVYFVSIDLGNFMQYKTIDELYKEWDKIDESQPDA